VKARRGPHPIKPSSAPVVELVEAAGAVERVFLVGDHRADMESATLAGDVLAARGGPPVAAIGLRGHAGLEEAGAWFVADLEEAGDLILAEPRRDLSLSFVLLAFDEEESIGRAVLDARRFARLYLGGHEVIVVDDGSRDRTAERARAMDEGDVRVLRHERNLGMGSAMRDGYRAARCELMAHLPGDRQLRPQALVRFLPHLAPETVVLSRYATPPSGSRRRWLSLVFRVLVRHLGGLRVDFAGTYVFARHHLARLELDQLPAQSYIFSFQLLQALADRGCRFEQVLVRPFPRERGGASREAALRRIALVLGEIVRHRLRQLTSSR